MTWLVRRIEHMADKVRTTVDPAILGDEEVDHYSIPALEATGRPERQAASDIQSEKQLLRGGEILISRLNPRKARVIRVPQRLDGTALASGEFVVLQPRVEPRFLEYLLLAESTRQGLDAAVQSVTRSHQRVRPEQILKMKVPMPLEREVQGTIADFLDTETNRIDALIAKKRLLIDLLTGRHIALIYRRTTGKDVEGARWQSGVDWVGELPAHWGLPWLGAYYSTQLGKMLNAKAAEGPDQHPYVRNTNVQWDRIEFDNLASMHFDSADRARCRLRRGDLLVCEGGEVGRAAVWPDEREGVYFQKAIHRVRPIGSGNTRFLMYCLHAAAALCVFAVEGNQSTIIHLTGEKLREHRFPFPPHEEQASIVEDLDRDRDATLSLSSRLEKQIALLQEHRQALITAAVTGEIDIPGAA